MVLEAADQEVLLFVSPDDRTVDPSGIALASQVEIGPVARSLGKAGPELEIRVAEIREKDP